MDMDNTAQQYIDLFEEQKSVFADSAMATTSHRQTACSYLKENGFPKYKSEDYQRTDLNAILEKDWGINLNRLKFPLKQTSHGFMCDLSETNSGSHCMVNDVYRADLSKNTALPQGVFAGSLSVFAAEHPDIFNKYYGTIAPPNHDGLVALNTMLVQDGFVLYVPKGVKIDAPFQLVQLMSGNQSIMAIRRNLIILEEDAQAQLLTCDHSLENEDYLSLQVYEIFADSYAKFELIEMEESSLRTNRISSLHLEQMGNSNVCINGFTVNNGITRNNFYCKFKEPHAELTLGGLAIGTDKQHIDNYTIIDHATTNCFTNELFKYVLSEESYGVFSGRIVVEPKAQKTIAYQSNRNLLLSKQAKMHSKPQLEIYADDVKCSHGMTTGQLDNDALFYLQQRGIPKDDAKTMLSIAFTEEVVNLSHIPGLQDRLHKIIEARFRGETIHCSKCNKCGVPTY